MVGSGGLSALPGKLFASHHHDEGSGSALAFRRYTLKPQDRLLLRDGRAVDLGGRAFDLLFVLLRSRGNVVSKEEIFGHVWPKTVVDESNLRFQMACLRRALGADRDVIKTVKGRGYLLAAEGGAVSQPMPQAIERDVELVPPKQGNHGQQQPHSNPALSAPKAGDPPIVAVIDDDDDTREALDGLLRSAGLRAEAYPSVQVFMQSGRQQQVRCLILDVWMPGRSGLDFQDDLAGCGLHLPVIFISGRADVQMSVRAMKAGAVEFLTKPVHHQDLLDAVQLAISSHNRAY